MKRTHRLLRSVNRVLSTALFVCGLLIFGVSPSSGQRAGWTGSAGMKSGCVGWNCDGKNPCTGMGCDGNSSMKDSKTGSTKTTGAGAANSSAVGNAKDSKGSTKGSSTKTKNSLPDVGALTGKSKKSDGWGGSRDSDTRTNEQRSAQDAVKYLPDVQGLTGGGKPPPDGWNGGLKSDSRTIEQKLDTP